MAVQQTQLPFGASDHLRASASAGRPRARVTTHRTSTPLPPAAEDAPVASPPAVPTPPLLLTVRDVEAELQLGRTRTYELLRSGVIPVVRVGRVLRVPREALRRWIDEQTTS